MEQKRGGYRQRVVVDEDQTGGHGHVCQQREGGQEFQVGDQDQQDDEGQEAEHVEAGVEAGDQDRRLVGVVGVAVPGGGVGCFHHLRGGEREPIRNGDAVI